MPFSVIYETFYPERPIQPWFTATINQELSNEGSILSHADEQNDETIVSCVIPFGEHESIELHPPCLNV